MKKYSVCIATYNGAKYIREQIESIQCQLDDQAEIIVSDDDSTDETLKIVSEMKEKDSRIQIVKGPKKGFSCNFENAVKHATGEIILFSDQDDIWEKDKVAQIERIFSKNADCTTVLHTMSTFDDKHEDTNAIIMGYKTGVLRNYIRSSYWGCCMAVKREFLIRFMPFRAYCVGHDQLTGLMSEKHGKTVFLDEKLLRHRLHGSNTSFTLPLDKKIKFRIELLRDYLYAEKIYKNKTRGKKK